jgi:lipopolysaccharide/colanic/teichoic acid biosynthesis glycosyltransferase
MNRMLDLAIALPALVATAPLVGALAVAVRLTSPGPAFFRHERVGRGRKKFRVIKLRTMTHASRGPDVTAADDARVTPLGKLLRKAKLDELPQLWNVVAGEMSIVGPRPETPTWTDRYPDAIFEVRPGITDHASIIFRDEEELLARASDRERAYRDVILPLKTACALDGIGRGPLFDLKVIARTALAIVRPERDHAVLARARALIEELR